MVFARVQDSLSENQADVLEELAESADCVKTVETHDDEQKQVLSANVNPLPCAQSTAMAMFDDVETMHVLEQDSSSWRLGLAVTKKTGCAVQRNRVKRVLREFFRLHQHDLPAHVDIVVVPKRHLHPRRVGLQYVTKELLPLFVEIRRYTMQKAEKHGVLALSDS